MTDTQEPKPPEPVDIEDLTYQLLSELACVDARDTNIRYHPAAYAAVERFAEALAAHRVAQERERWRETVIRAAAYANHYGREGFFVTCSPDASSQVLTWALNPQPPETGKEN